MELNEFCSLIRAAGHTRWKIHPLRGLETIGLSPLSPLAFVAAQKFRGSRPFRASNWPQLGPNLGLSEELTMAIHEVSVIHGPCTNEGLCQAVKTALWAACKLNSEFHKG